MLEILQARINPTYKAHVICQFQFQTVRTTSSKSFLVYTHQLKKQNSFISTALTQEPPSPPLPSPTNNNDEAFLKTYNNSPD